MMAPSADVRDGMFDVVAIPRVGWGTILRVIPRIFKGTHLTHPDVRHFRTTRLHVTSRPGTPVHGDGEMVTNSAETLLYEVLPGKLSLLTPS